MNYARADRFTAGISSIIHGGPRSMASLEGMDALISSAKLVSFDIFDTLLVRQLAEPADVFLLMERETGVTGFHAARIKAEAKAREMNDRRQRTHEVTLQQIYDQLIVPAGAKSGWTVSELMQHELETEARLLTPSPMMAALYDMAVRAGKRVIGISDMYLPESFLLSVLQEAGMPVERVFISGAWKCAKHDGKLYDVVAGELGIRHHEIVHFGDNFLVDCKAALEAGVAGYHVPHLRDGLFRDNLYNQGAISRLVQTFEKRAADEKNLFASAIIAWLARFRADNQGVTIAALFGAMYAGPLVTGFATWLDSMMAADGVRHLRLMTRDGYITKDVWDRLGLQGACSVLHSSRRLTIVPALLHGFEEEIDSLLNTSTAMTLRENIKRLKLENEGQVLRLLARFTALDRPIDTPRRAAESLRALRQCRGVFEAAAKDELAGYKAYLAERDFCPQKDAVADCGWALSSQRRMEKFLKKKLRGYYIGTLEHAYRHDGIKSFLFHNGMEKEWRDIAERGIELLELPYASLEEQICRFSCRDGKIIPVHIDRDVPHEMVRSVFIRRMHGQTRQFADYIRPILPAVTLEEIGEVLFILFDALVNAPTPFEYHELAWLPHNREYGKSEFATIGTFWRPSGHLCYFYGTSRRTVWRYIKMGLVSLRYMGVRITWARVKRVVRREVFATKNRMLSPPSGRGKKRHAVPHSAPDGWPSSFE